MSSILLLHMDGDIIVGHVQARQYDQAIEQVPTGAQEESKFRVGLCVDGRRIDRRAQFPEASAASERLSSWSPTTPHRRCWLTCRPRSEWKKPRKLLDDVEQQASHGYVCAYEVAQVYANLGDNDHAFQWMQKGVKEQCDC